MIEILILITLLLLVIVIYAGIGIALSFYLGGTTSKEMAFTMWLWIFLPIIFWQVERAEAKEKQ